MKRTAKLVIGRRSAVAGIGAVLAAPALAQGSGTAELVAAATKEGTAVWHTSIDLPVAQKMVGLFAARYPQVRIQLERSGAERVLQRITQEYASGIKAADVVESSDASMFVDFKQRGWLGKHVPPDVAAHWPADERDRDGTYAAVRGQLSVLAYNTKQVKAEEAPKSFADLLHPRWRMRMVKAHPGYSGTILTSTFATANALGWGYFDELAKQRILQVQSASDPPKKVAQGERSVMVDGSEYVVFYLKEAGNPIDVVYPTEGSPLIAGQMAVMEAAPHPAAARLFCDFVFSAECQQLMSDQGGIRSFHPAVKLPPGRRQLSEIKVLPTDPDALVKAAAEVKRRYTAAFGV
jgi:iron(III) transport system substrate-binding protein